MKLTAALVATILSAGAAHAQIFVVDNLTSVISEYSTGGTLITSNTAPFNPNQLVSDGTDLYALGNDQ